MSTTTTIITCGYKLREGGSRYDHKLHAWTVGHYEFAFPQMADVFVYCWRAYGPPVAEKVKATLKEMIHEIMRASGKNNGQTRDVLMALPGVATLPGQIMAPAAVKVLADVEKVIGYTILRDTAKMRRNLSNFFNDSSPTTNTAQYCRYVIYSWIIDAANGPYYRTG